MTQPSTPHKATPEQWANLEQAKEPIEIHPNVFIGDKNTTIAACLLELRARVEALEANSSAGLTSSSNASTPFQVPPPNCNQRLQREGKPYPKSDCEACGTMSPMWRHCDLGLNMEAMQQPTVKAAPAGSLMERVAWAVWGCDAPENTARAAIREVAAWLKETHGWSDGSLMRLEQEAER